MEFPMPTIRQRADRRKSEGVVPMINVVFLLMIFFLMSTTLSPERNAAVAVPESEAGVASEGGRELVVGADGGLAWGQYRGDAAMAAVEAAYANGTGGVLVIKADRAVAGAEIARLIARLRTAGVTESALVTGG
ncbi:MAG: biopolymer transporter ExbD [Pseudomonadota bacterium]